MCLCRAPQVVRAAAGTWGCWLEEAGRWRGAREGKGRAECWGHGLTCFSGKQWGREFQLCFHGIKPEVILVVKCSSFRSCSSFISYFKAGELQSCHSHVFGPFLSCPAPPKSVDHMPGPVVGPGHLPCVSCG